jgi:hypothetical protein
MRKCHRWEDWWKLFGQGVLRTYVGFGLLRSAPKHLKFLPHVKNIMNLMWNFFSSNYEVWKKRYGILKSPSNEIGPKLKLSGDSKNSPKIQSFIVFWSEKTIGSISQKQPGSSPRKFGLLWNNLIQFALFYLQKPHGGLTVL